MGWVTLSLRKATLKRQINDNQLQLLQLQNKLNKLTTFSTAIGSGESISPALMASLGTDLFGDALDYMNNSDMMASEMADTQLEYYTTTYEGITAQQYVSSGLASQVSLYFNSDGTLDTDRIRQKFYEENLKEYANDYMPYLNEAQKEIESKISELETLDKTYEEELRTVSDSISNQISTNTIKLA